MIKEQILHNGNNNVTFNGVESMSNIVDRPGYFGRKRERRVQFYDDLYGPGHWEEMWDVAGDTLSFAQAVELYDEAYYRHLSSNPQVVDFVIAFGECYDCDPSNIRCGTCHDQRSIPRHIQDVSVRRALKRLGVWFKGSSDYLLQIRGEESNGFQLNPGQVHFHDSSLICHPPFAGPIPGWAKPDSVEAFWQANKVIVLDTRLIIV